MVRFPAIDISTSALDKLAGALPVFTGTTRESWRAGVRRLEYVSEYGVPAMGIVSVSVWALHPMIDAPGLLEFSSSQDFFFFAFNGGCTASVGTLYVQLMSQGEKCSSGTRHN